MLGAIDREYLLALAEVDAIAPEAPLFVDELLRINPHRMVTVDGYLVMCSDGETANIGKILNEADRGELR